MIILRLSHTFNGYIYYNGYISLLVISHTHGSVCDQQPFLFVSHNGLKVIVFS